VSLEKYAVASALWQAGYQIRAICEIMGVSRSSFYRWRRRQAGSGFPDLKFLGSRDPAGDAQILASIQEIKLRHPFWGYRRVRAWLKYREGLPVGHKRVYRPMKENELLVPQKRYRAKLRGPGGSGLTAVSSWSAGPLSETRFRQWLSADLQVFLEGDRHPGYRTDIHQL
jgi:transposase